MSSAETDVREVSSEENGGAGADDADARSAGVRNVGGASGDGSVGGGSREGRTSAPGATSEAPDSEAMVGEAPVSDASAGEPLSDSLNLLHRVVDSMGGTRRQGQDQMVLAVDHALERREHLLVQAGTGTGKSLAYLVPLILHALSAQRPVLVATATLALQTQIVKRDLPKLLEAAAKELPRPIDYAILKGRSNYLCKHKIAGGFPQDGDESDALIGLDALAPTAGGTSELGKEVLRLRAWAQETTSGDRDDLRPGVTDQAWRQVSVSALECLGATRCPMAAECFSEQAKIRASEADVVVTNHALLALAAFDNPAVLPTFDVVVVDEAHELRDRVTSATSASLSANAVRSAERMLRHSGVVIASFTQSVQELEKALEQLDDGYLPAGPGEQLVEAVRAVQTSCRDALSALTQTGAQGGGQSASHQGTSGGGGTGAEAAGEGAKQNARSELNVLVDTCERVCAGANDPQEVVWIQRPRPYNAPSYGTPAGAAPGIHDLPATIWVAPLSVASRLRTGLFEERTVILTSATLAIGSQFDSVAGDLGLGGSGAPSWQGVDVGSPFDYPRQGVLYVAKDLPAPGRASSEAGHEELEALIRAAGGGVLALFSSRRAAEDAAAAMRSRIRGIEILCQGESSTAALIEQFAEEEDTCLFGTMTLWQGVDVPGHSCRLVVIDRIPFPRPDDPLTIARSKEVERHRGNGFMRISAQHAAVRLAQGAGRLIRAQGDRGVVAVLDSRLANARYGSFLRAALPPFWSTTDRATVLGALERLAGPREQ